MKAVVAYVAHMGDGIANRGRSPNREPSQVEPNSSDQIRLGLQQVLPTATAATQKEAGQKSESESG